MRYRGKRLERPLFVGYVTPSHGYPLNIIMSYFLVSYFLDRDFSVVGFSFYFLKQSESVYTTSCGSVAPVARDQLSTAYPTPPCLISSQSPQGFNIFPLLKL